MSKREKQAVVLSAVLSLALCGATSASAMHIMEGYLPPSFCVIWGVICLPFLVAGVFSIRRIAKEQRKAMLLLAMAGAFVFVISSLKIPSVTGSCSHMTGTGLAAILFGVPATAVLGIIVLVFQAILLAHGGLTTLGANTFSMAIAGPLVSWGLYRAGRKLNLPKKLNVFLAAATCSPTASPVCSLPWHIPATTAAWPPVWWSFWVCLRRPSFPWLSSRGF